MEELATLREVLTRVRHRQVVACSNQLCLTVTQTLESLQTLYRSTLPALLLSQTLHFHLSHGQFGLMILQLVISWLEIPSNSHFLREIDLVEECFSQFIDHLKPEMQSIDTSNVELLRNIVASAREVHIPGNRWISEAVLEAYLCSIPSKSIDFTNLNTRVSIQIVENPGSRPWSVLQGVLIPYTGRVEEKKEVKVAVYESV